MVEVGRGVGLWESLLVRLLSGRTIDLLFRFCRLMAWV